MSRGGRRSSPRTKAKKISEDGGEGEAKGRRGGGKSKLDVRVEGVRGWGVGYRRLSFHNYWILPRGANRLQAGCGIVLFRVHALFLIFVT